MFSGLNWILNQQYVPGDIKQRHEVSFMDRLVDQFSCSRDDHYNIEGAMGMPLPPFVASFSTDLLQGNMLGVADEDGHVKLIDTSKRKSTSILKEWSAHSNAVFDLAWIEKESKMVTASGDQTARLWDIEKCVTIGNFRGHTCSLKSIAVQPGSSRILLTGARDGNIMVWDTRCNLRNGYHTPINIIRKSHERAQLNSVNSTGKKKKKKRQSCQADSKQSVTAAVFLDDCRIISTGACDGAIKYWDIRKNYSNLKGEALAYHIINFAGKGPRKHGFSSLILNSSSSRLFSVCTNNIIYEFPTTNLSSQPIATYQGHQASSFYVKAALSPDDRYLLCGSGDNSAYIWRTDRPNANPWILSGHCGEVTSVAWSPNNGEKLVTCSDDNTFKIWRPFQENTDPLLSCGTVKRKTMMAENSKTTSKGPEVTLQEDVLDLDIPERKSKCFCNSLNMVSNRKVRVRWNIGVVQHAKDTSSKTGVRTKSWSASSPFTTVTPKSSNNPTPNLPLHEKLNISPPISPARNLSCNVKCTAQTPTSSRVFMESWLKSPRTPGQESPVNKNSNGGEGRFLFPRSDNGNSSRENTPEVENKTLESKEKLLENQCNVNFWGKHLKQEKLSSNSRSPSPQPSRKKSSARSKRYINTGQFVDIKTMLLAMKRKCNSPPDETDFLRKRSKSEKGNSLGLNPAEVFESDEPIFAGEAECVVSDKENIPNYIKMISPSKAGNNETLTDMGTSMNVLKENSTQQEVKDILDYAEDLSGS